MPLYFLLRSPVVAVSAASGGVRSIAFFGPVVLEGVDLPHAAALLNLGLLLEDWQLRPQPGGFHIPYCGELLSATQ